MKNQSVIVGGIENYRGKNFTQIFILMLINFGQGPELMKLNKTW